MPATAHGDVWGVSDTTDTPVGQSCPAVTGCSLREAVTSTETNPGADSILVSAGTYPLTNGQLTVTQDLTVSRVGAGIGRVEGTGSRIFDVNGSPVDSADLVLRGLTLSGASVSDPVQADGGAILADEDTTLEVQSTTIQNSSVAGGSLARGGAIFSQGDVTIRAADDSTTGSAIAGNTVSASDAGAQASGGGVAVVGVGATLTVGPRSSITDNVALGTEADSRALGGGVFAESGADLTQATVSGNAAEGGEAIGGGIGIESGTVSLTRSTLSGNSAAGSGDALTTGGGAVGVEDNGGPAGTVDVALSTLAQNSAGFIGAPAAATAAGGAILNDTSGATTLTNSTVAFNAVTAAGTSTAQGGAVSGGTVTFGASIVAENTQPGSSECADSTLTSDGFNVLGPVGDCGGGTVASDATDVTDAGLGPLASNGGLTQTVGLELASPAVDRIPAADTLCTNFATDQRGVSRPQHGDCDSGSFEARWPSAVNDDATVAEDSGFTPIDVLANDNDPDQNAVIESVDTTGTNGAVNITGGGSGVEYEPDLEYCNDPPGTTPDTFTYTLNSGSTATVSVTVTCDADPHTYFVRTTGSGTVCTQANPCATVAEALAAHRGNPNPGDVIDVGPGTFVGNVEADQPEDEGLTIRGTLDGSTRQTTLRGEGAGAFGYAVLLGTCIGEEVKLRDANVDTVDADSNVSALSLDGGSDLLNVHASNQPGSDAFGVVDVCQRGSTIDRTEIVAEGDVPALNVIETVRLQDSTVSGENESAIEQFSAGDPNWEMRIRRSNVSLPASSPTPVVTSSTRLAVDSSLITGGAAGVQTFEGVEWLINNSTIDAGVAGVADPATPSLFLQPFGTAEVDIDSSILVDGVESSDGDGTLGCNHSDLPEPSLFPGWTDECEIGANGNTTTDPADLFVGGAPYDWMLKAGSPAIDTGQPGAVPAGLAIRDVIGNPRRAAGTTATCPDGIRDKGAYEYVGPPCNIGLPQVLNGDEPEPGSKLSSFRGEWSDKPTGFARLWFRCDELGDDCVEIDPPKTRKGYTVRGPDLGHTLRVQVIASNAAGDSDPALSDPTGVVEAPAG